MSADKYPSIFSRQMATIVYIFLPQMKAIVFSILQIVFATGAVLKIGEYLTIRLRARVFYVQIVDEA